MEPVTIDEAWTILESQPVAHLGVVIDGVAYVTPMSFVVNDRHILFRTLAGHKLDAIRANPRVCIEVSRFDAGTGDWESVIAWGNANEVVDDDTKSLTTSLLFKKYGGILGSPLSHGGGMRVLQGFPHVVEVAIDQISGMTSGRGWSVRTRPGRL